VVAIFQILVVVVVVFLDLNDTLHTYPTYGLHVAFVAFHALTFDSPCLVRVVVGVQYPPVVYADNPCLLERLLHHIPLL
jgi:hypothetical protein